MSETSETQGETLRGWLIQFLEQLTNTTWDVEQSAEMADEIIARFDEYLS